MRKIVFAITCAVLLCDHAQAGTEDAVPSCYDRRLGATPAQASTELFVLIDQTTVFDTTLQQQVADNIRPFMTADNAFSVLAFSAFSQGRYAQVLGAGTIEPGIAPALRDDISKPLLAKFDACQKRQPQVAMQAIGAALRAAFSGSSGDLAKSDVMASLKSISARVKKSTAKEKLVLIASDMLENSSITSFYDGKGNAVRQIDVPKELKLASENDMFGDFGGAKVYVVGAGLLTADAKKGNKYRDPKTMRALSGFWGSYFQKSQATLVELGQPALLNSIRSSH